MKLPDINLSPVPTSYFSQAEKKLDPRLFDGDRMHPHIRKGLQELLFGHLREHYRDPDSWARAWVAGSGASYQWSAARSPGDLDVLVGVDYPKFRESNVYYTGLSDDEISKSLTKGFRTELQPRTTNWNGFETTFFANPRSTNIKTIHPYAAYDIVHDNWAVHPDEGATPPHTAEGDTVAGNDVRWAGEILDRYNTTKQQYENAHDPAVRRNAHSYMRMALGQGSDLFDEIHGGRHSAFGAAGQGYADINNYRWQAAKDNGVIGALNQMSVLNKQIKDMTEISLYQQVIADKDEALLTALMYGVDKP